MFTSQIIGNAGHDASVQTAKDGKIYIKFSVGANTGKNETTWINVHCTGKLGETAKEWIKKGMLLYISGTTNVAAYLNKNNEPAYNVTVWADKIKFLSRKDQDKVGDSSQKVHEDSINECPF